MFTTGLRIIVMAVIAGAFFLAVVALFIFFCKNGYRSNKRKDMLLDNEDGPLSDIETSTSHRSYSKLFEESTRLAETQDHCRIKLGKNKSIFNMAHAIV